MEDKIIKLLKDEDDLEKEDKKEIRVEERTTGTSDMPTNEEDDTNE